MNVARISAMLRVSFVLLLLVVGWFFFRGGSVCFVCSFFFIFKCMVRERIGIERTGFYKSV